MVVDQALLGWLCWVVSNFFADWVVTPRLLFCRDVIWPGLPTEDGMWLVPGVDAVAGSPGVPGDVHDDALWATF